MKLLLQITGPLLGRIIYFVSVGLLLIPLATSFFCGILGFFIGLLRQLVNAQLQWVIVWESAALSALTAILISVPVTAVAFLSLRLWGASNQNLMRFYWLLCYRFGEVWFLDV